MDRTEATRIVSNTGWLSRQSSAFRSAFLQRSLILCYSKGDVVFTQGDEGSGIYGVLAGSFTVEVLVDNSASKLAHIMRVGSWFGTRPALVGRPRALSFRAAELSHAVHLSSAALSALASDDATTYRCLCALAEDNTDLTRQVATDLMISSSEQRITAVLLRLAGVTAIDAQPPPYTLCLTQALLGEAANASRAVVSRALVRFERRGWIALGYNRIDLLNVPALMHVAAG